MFANLMNKIKDVTKDKPEDTAVASTAAAAANAAVNSTVGDSAAPVTPPVVAANAAATEEPAPTATIDTVVANQPEAEAVETPKTPPRISPSSTVEQPTGGAINMLIPPALANASTTEDQSGIINEIDIPSSPTAPPPTLEVVAMTPADRYKHRLLDFFQRYDPMKRFSEGTLNALVDPINGVPEHVFFALLLKSYGLSTTAASGGGGSGNSGGANAAGGHSGGANDVAAATTTAGPSPHASAAMGKHTSAAPNNNNGGKGMTPSNSAHRSSPISAANAGGNNNHNNAGKTTSTNNNNKAGGLSVLSDPSDNSMADMMMGGSVVVEASPTMLRAKGLGVGAFEDENSAGGGGGSLKFGASPGGVRTDDDDNDGPVILTPAMQSGANSPITSPPTTTATNDAVCTATVEESCMGVHGSASPSNVNLMMAITQPTTTTSGVGGNNHTSKPHTAAATKPNTSTVPRPRGASLLKSPNTDCGVMNSAGSSEWRAEWDTIVAPFLPSVDFQPKSWNSNSNTATNPSTSKFVVLDPKGAAMHGQRIIYGGVHMLVDHRNMLVGPDMRALDGLNALNPFGWAAVEGVVPADSVMKVAVLGDDDDVLMMMGQTVDGDNQQSYPLTLAGGSSALMTNTVPPEVKEGLKKVPSMANALVTSAGTTTTSTTGGIDASSTGAGGSATTPSAVLIKRRKPAADDNDGATVDGSYDGAGLAYAYGYGGKEDGDGVKRVAEDGNNITVITDAHIADIIHRRRDDLVDRAEKRLMRSMLVLPSNPGAPVAAGGGGALSRTNSIQPPSPALSAASDAPATKKDHNHDDADDASLDNASCSSASSLVSDLSDMAVIEDVELFKFLRPPPMRQNASTSSMGSGCNTNKGGGGPATTTTSLPTAGGPPPLPPNYMKMRACGLYQQSVMASKRAIVANVNKPSFSFAQLVGGGAAAAGNNHGINNASAATAASIAATASAAALSATTSAASKGYAAVASYVDDILIGLDDSFASGSSACRSVQSPIEICEVPLEAEEELGADGEAVERTDITGAKIKGLGRASSGAGANAAAALPAVAVYGADDEEAAAGAKKTAAHEDPTRGLAGEF